MHLYHLLATACTGSECGKSLRFTKFEATIGLLGLLLSLVSAVLVGMRWIYGRGSANKEQLTATSDNTKATKALTVSFEKFADKTGDQMNSMEHRLTVLEVRTQLSGMVAENADRRAENTDARIDAHILVADKEVKEFTAGQDRQDKNIGVLQNGH